MQRRSGARRMGLRYTRVICRHAANLGVTAVAAVNPSKRKTYCLAFYGQHKLLPHAGEHPVLHV